MSSNKQDSASGTDPSKQGGKRGNSKGGGRDKNKQGERDKDLKGYVGHTKELGDFVITHNGNKVTQFKELLDRLSTYAASEHSADVGTSIDEMRAASMRDFMPEPLDSSLWTVGLANPDGTPVLDPQGQPRTRVDEATRTMLEAMQAQLLKKQTDLYTSYVSGLRAMFRVILGQVDKNMKQKLESRDDWDRMKSGNDTIKLLKTLRELCYQDARTTVHPMTNAVRAQRKLVTSRQRNDDCSAFVREVNERFRVYKALGGSVLSAEVVSASLESEPINLTQYNLLNSADRAAYDRRAEQRYLAAIIVEGSSEDTSTLKTTLAQQYTLGANLYPNDTSRALEMLLEFQGTKQPKPKKPTKPGDRKKASESTGSKQTGTTLVNTTTESERDVEGAQMLMAGLASNESFNLNEVLFFQAGEVTYGDVETDSASVSSDNTEDDWNYWLDHDNSQAPSSSHKSGSNDDALVTLLPDGSTAPDDLATICIQPSTTNMSDLSPLTGDASPSQLDRSGRTSTPRAPRAQDADDGEHKDNESNSNIQDKALTTAEYSIQEATKVSSQAEELPIAIPEVKHKISANNRPDPPGHRLAEEHRSAQNHKHRSGTLALGIHNSGTANTMKRGHAHDNNIAALDLAITDWQYETLVRRKHFQYSHNVQNLFAQSNRGGIDPHWLLLDSESSVNLIVNRSLLHNIRTAPNGANMIVHCNAGTAKTNQIGDLRGFGTVWFYEGGIANVISLGLVTNKFRVTMDSDVDNALNVHKPNGEIRRFHRGSNNLYYYDTRSSTSEETLLTITTVEGQKELFSGLDRKRAARAAKLQEILMYPSDKDFIQMIERKTLHNCPITKRDFAIAQQIYGKNRAILQGKTIRRQVPHTREDISPVPDSILKNYRNIALSCDVIYINNVRFVVTISRHINYRTIRAVTNARMSTLVSVLKSVIGEYKSRGFKVESVFADNQFECIRDSLLELRPPVTLNVTSAGEHEPHIERSNRTVKERIRCAFNSTPFKRMPRRMVIELAYSAVFWLNSFVSEGGVSRHMSPRELMVGTALDANRHARYQFGEYLMSHEDETNNSMDPRALDTIFLRPSGNLQGGFFALDLSTGERIHRMHATPLPMTKAVIDRVFEMARKQDAPEGLIFGDASNQNTIDDMDFENNDDDDNASDASYKLDKDDESIMTELSDTTDVSEVSGNIDEHEEPHENNEEDNLPEQRDDVDEDAVDHAVMDEEPINQEEAVQVSDHEGHDEFPTPGGNDDDDDPRDEESDPGEDPDSDTQTHDEEETESRSIANDGLRRTVRRTHNKYGEEEGFATSVLHRGSLFTAGFGPALDKMTSDEIGYMHVASAIAQYNNIDASQVTKQYGVRQGIKIFGDDGVDAVLKELKQIHERTVIAPMDPRDMPKELRDKALPYLMFLKRKRCGKVKGRGCADGRRQREFISKEEASSPTVSLYALMISCLIDAIEGRDVATADIPGAFLQTDMPEGEDVYIRLDGTMAELLCRLDPKLYNPCMINNNGRKVLYAKAKKAIYGTLRAALLFWENLSGFLTKEGFITNPYDSCTMNKMIDGSQATICWHVDDLKISHKKPEVVTAILDRLNEEYGKISPLTVTRGKVHDYVGMTIDYSEAGQVKFSMFDYLEEIIQNLPDDFKGEAQTPASNHLFTVDEDGTKLTTEKAEQFHHYVAKLLFMAKRTRPDIMTAIAFLCTRVKEPDEHDWKKLSRVMKYLQLTPFLPLCLGWDGTGDVNWYVDASFAVHKDMRSHTGGMMTLGQGALISISSKQKINTKSSTEAELVGVDDVMNLQVWSRYFLDAQYEHAGNDLLRKTDRLHQDNTSSIRLEKNGKQSSTKRTRHIDIRYFFITDRVKAGRIDIEYCPTEEMIADFFTKPLQGTPFRSHRNNVMGITTEGYLRYKDEYNKVKRNNKVGVSFSPAIVNDDNG